MKKYFLGLVWVDKDHPVMHLKDYFNSNDEYFCVPDTFDFEKFSTKVCCGSINPLTREYFACRKIINKDQSQCYSCMHKYDFFNCIKCHGQECTAKDNEVISYCNTPHYVYLAYFSKDKIKVGTASEIRKHDRLLEQGAIFSIFIAKTPTGKIAREIEKEIIDNGITGSVTTLFKMKNLIFDESMEDVKNELIKYYQLITRIVSKENSIYLIYPEFNCFTSILDKVKKHMLSETNQIDLFCMQSSKVNEHKILKDSSHVVGDFLFAVGKIIALSNDGVIQLCDSKKWEGFLVDFKNTTMFKAYEFGGKKHEK